MPPKAARADAQKLPVDLIKKLSSKLIYGAQIGSEEAITLHEMYKKAPHAEKLSILHKFQEDPSLKWVYSFQAQTTESEATESLADKAWFTRSQLASIEKLNENDPTHKSLLDALCASLPQRKHEDKVWADLGLLQYERERKKQSYRLKTQKDETVSQKIEGKAVPKKKPVKRSDPEQVAEVSWSVAVRKAVTEGQPGSNTVDFVPVRFSFVQHIEPFRHKILKFLQGLVTGSSREASKCEQAEERKMIRDAGVVAQESMEALTVVLASKEDTEEYHGLLQLETEKAAAASELFRDFLLQKAPKAVPKSKALAQAKPQEPEPQQKEPEQKDAEAARELSEPVPKRRYVGKTAL